MSGQSADAIVVGAGIIGASVAFHLAQSGLKVAVLDQDGSAGGATGASAGFVRVFHPQPELTELAHRSLPAFSDRSEGGLGSSGFVETGCVHDFPHFADVEAATATSQKLGAGWKVLRNPELRLMFPRLNWRDDTVALFEPEAGYADPRQCVKSYLARLLDLGGAVRTETVARSVHAVKKRAAAVVTSDGPLSADTVVIAIGPWSAGSVLIDCETKLRTRRITTQRFRSSQRVDEIPAYINEEQSFFFRPNGPHELLVGIGGREVDRRNAHDEDVLALALARGKVEERAGELGPIGETVSGLDAYTADGLPIIDRHPLIDRVYVATGFSGSGFKIAPAVGDLLASWICTGVRHETLEPFSFDRFPQEPQLAEA